MILFHHHSSIQDKDWSKPALGGCAQILVLYTTRALKIAVPCTLYSYLQCSRSCSSRIGFMNSRDYITIYIVNIKYLPNINYNGIKT